MHTLTKITLGLMGQLKPLPAMGHSSALRDLPSPTLSGGMPLFAALNSRQSRREFLPEPLPDQQLSDLLWAAAGVNRHESGGRTAPSAMNSQEVLLYVAMPQGLFLYEPAPHRLRRMADMDVRRVTGHQDFVDNAPLDLVYVADHTHMKLVPAAQREGFAFASAGAMAQNVYLFCASEGLSTVMRAWFDRSALADAVGLHVDQQLLLAQTVGQPLRA